MASKKFVEEFFKKRFRRKPEQDLMYFMEWQERFMKGDPRVYMDDKSLKVFKKLKKKYGIA